MSQKPIPSLDKVAVKLRDDLNTHNFVLLFAYNGTGKTRLSMAFKDRAKKKGAADTLYYNAYTEDLFTWENDYKFDVERFLKMNSESRFFKGLKDLDLDTRIRSYLNRYSDFNFSIDYDSNQIQFSRDVIIRGKLEKVENIKISRGEESIFIWCFYLAITKLVIDGHESYNWVKFLYIDDPISSLDDNNAIAVAYDLAQLIKENKVKLGVIISSHHSLFYNVMFNELKKQSTKSYFLHSLPENKFILRSTEDTPFFHHVAILKDLKQAVNTGKVYTYHFNVLRTIMEKTATFFGKDDFSSCIHGIQDQGLFARALNLFSHGSYSVFDPVEMLPDNKLLFSRILEAFLTEYPFLLPELTVSKQTVSNAP